MKTILLFCVLFFSTLCLTQSGCGVVVPFVGPIDHPRFEIKNWKELSLKYWVVTSTESPLRWEEVERDLHISGTDIDELRRMFITQSCQGSVQGSTRPWTLKMDSHDEWYFELASPDSCFFCNVTNTDRAYFVKTASTTFYSHLKEICFENEKRMTPDILIENIRICRRFGGNESPQERITAYAGTVLVPPQE